MAIPPLGQGRAASPGESKHGHGVMGGHHGGKGLWERVPAPGCHHHQGKDRGMQPPPPQVLLDEVSVELIPITGVFIVLMIPSSQGIAKCSSTVGDVWGSRASRENLHEGGNRGFVVGWGDLRQHRAMALVTQLSLPGRS